MTCPKRQLICGNWQWEYSILRQFDFRVKKKNLPTLLNSIYLAHPCSMITNSFFGQFLCYCTSSRLPFSRFLPFFFFFAFNNRDQNEGLVQSKQAHVKAPLDAHLYLMIHGKGVWERGSWETAVIYQRLSTLCDPHSQWSSYLKYLNKRFTVFICIIV